MIEAAADALRAGSAVVLPNPHPLTSVVAATTPAVVNTAKGRPADQAVALWLAADGHWTDFARSLDLDADTRALARDLLVREHLTLLLPLSDVPDWVGPAARDGHALVFGACWAPLRPLLAAAGRLHVSSANRTGHPPVSSAGQARAVFPPEVHVLAASDGLPAEGRRATTTLRVGRDRALAHTRSGAQDLAHGGPDAYLAHLRQSFVDRP